MFLIYLYEKVAGVITYKVTLNLIKIRLTQSSTCYNIYYNWYFLKIHVLPLKMQISFIKSKMYL